jgi:limonene 1,2-monooxygenase
MVANRYIQLDHHSRGRTMLGVGPGALTGDAYMMGIEPPTQRPRMQEAVEIIKRLWTETEPITYESDWFVLREARLHLRPYTHPHPEIAVAAVQSPSGMVTAGKHGLSVLSLNIVADRGKGADAQKRTLADFWQMAEETAEEHGQTMNRHNWRIVVHTHVAETKKEAIAQARDLAGSYQRDYFENTLGVPSPFPDVPKDQLVDALVDAGVWAVGTPDDVSEAILRVDEQTGGFGGFLIQATNWGTREQVRHSYELIARYVIPRFKGQMTGVEDSQEWYAENREFLNELRTKSLDEAQEIYDRRRAEMSNGS